MSAYQAQASQQALVARRTRAKARKSLWMAGSYLLLVFVATLFFLPFFWLVSTSLKPETSYATYPVIVFPARPQFVNYYKVLFEYPFIQYFRNTLFLAITSTILTVLSSSLGGFGFARHTAPLRNTMFLTVLSLLMVPGLVTLIPNFMLFSRLRITNTYWPWVLWGLRGSPFHIFLFRQFFAAIPKDLEDAAEVDGCGRFRIYWQMFLPNSGPVLAVSSIFQFQSVWGDWFTPNIMLPDRLTTLGVKLSGTYVAPGPLAPPIVTVTMAAIVIFILPMITVFFLAQKYIIQGVVTSGLKG